MTEKLTTHSSEETVLLAKRFAASLKPKDVLALEGDLGAGKTCFVKGLAAGLNVPEKLYVRSPSFTLLNEYRGGRLPLYHFDFYRLTNADELADLGLDEYFDGDGVTVIEWADRFPGELPRNARHVKFKIVSENEREIEEI